MRRSRLVTWGAGTLAVAALGIVVWVVSAPGPRASAELVQADGLPDPADGRDAVLRWAEQTLAGSCMVDHGFSFWVHWRAEEAADHDDGTTRYVLSDRSRAQAEGFGIGTALHSAPSRPRSPNEDYVESLPPRRQVEYGLAFHGDPGDAVSVTLPSGTVASVSVGGCLSQARSQLYTDLREWLRLSTFWANVDAEAAELVRATPEFTEAVEAWSDCMRRGGWEVSEPGELRSQVAEAYRTEPREVASRTERDAAVAEVECAQATGLARAAERLHDAFVDELEGSRSADRRAYDEMLDAAYDRALRLLDSYRRTAG